jgi:hypothetical protein
MEGVAGHRAEDGAREARLLVSPHRQAAQVGEQQRRLYRQADD